MKASQQRLKTSLSLVITVLLVLVLLLWPGGAAFGLTGDITTDKAPDSTYKLGQTVTFPVTLTFTAQEGVPDTVDFEINGSIPTPKFAVPVTPGTYTFTNQLPPSFFKPDGSYNSVSGNVSLSAVVTSTNIGTSSGTGYGYGYSYQAGSSGGTVNITITYKPPVLKFPVPVDVPTLPAAASLFNITGGQIGQGGPGPTQSGPPAFPTFGLMGSVFGVPGTDFNSKARALGIPQGGKADIILDGTSPDVLARFGLGPGYLFLENSVTLPTISGKATDQIHALTHINANKVVVAGGDTGATAFAAIIDINLNSFPSSAATATSASLSLNNRPGGAAYDGNFIYISEFQPDPAQPVKVVKLNKTTLAQEGTFNVSLGAAGLPGFDGLDYNPVTTTFFGAAHGSDNLIIQFDNQGKTIGAPLKPKDMGNMDISDDITGLGIFNSGQQNEPPILLAVTKNDRNVYASSLIAGGQVAQGQFSNTPTFVARDGGEYFVGVEGQPDVIRVFAEDGAQIRTLTPKISGTPIGTEDIDAGTFVGPDLWVADSGSSVTLRKLNKQTGEQITSIQLSGLVQHLGGLAYDGTDFIGYERFFDTFYKIDPTTGSIKGTFGVTDPNPSDFFFPPGGAEDITVSGGKLLAIRNNKIIKISLGPTPPVGQIESGFELGFEVDGRGLDKGSLLIADAGYLGPRILKGAFPGEAASEKTAAGSYTAKILSGTALLDSASFTLQKVSPFEVKITSPSDGDGIEAADLDANGKITVTGTVNDFTVSSVSFGAVLGKTLLIGAPVDAPVGPFNLENQAQKDAVKTSGTQATTDWEVTGLWHVTTDTNAPGGKKYQGTAGFYYGRDGSSPASAPTGPQYTYETPLQANSGNLDTRVFTVGDDTKLTFSTWYNTEPTFDFDQKLIQFCTNASSCTTVAQIVDMVPPPAPPQPPFFLPPAPPQPGTVYKPAQVGAVFPPFNDGRDFIYIPNNSFGPNGQPQIIQVELKLSKTLGTGFLRFRFDTKDPFGNNLEGWYADSIAVEGSGAASGDTFPVTNGQWSGKFKPVDGENKITVNASRSAYDPETDSDTVTVFLDIENPVVSFAPPADVSGNALASKTFSPITGYVSASSFVKVKGTFTELTPATLEIFSLFNTNLTTLLGKNVFTDSDKKLIFTKKTFDSTTLAQAADVGATEIQVADNSKFTIGDSVRIGTGADAEVRAVTSKPTGKLAFTTALTVKRDVGTKVSNVSYSADVNLGTTDGFTKLGVKLTDKSGLSGTGEQLLVVDTGKPTITVNKVIYPTGAISARASDPVIVDVTASDTFSGVKTVYFGSTTNELKKATDIPDLIKGKFGITGTHVLFGTVSANAPPGTVSFAISAKDEAGNTETQNAQATVVASLQAMNYFLGSGANLIGMNLQPTTPDWVDILSQVVSASDLSSTFVAGLSLGSTTSSAGVSAGATSIAVSSVSNLAVGDVVKIGTSSENRRITAISGTTLTLNKALASAYGSGTPVVEQVKLADVVQAVYYFTGGTATSGNWLVYSSSGASNTLTNAQQGRAYWVIAKSGAFKDSTPLPGFTTGTPIPVRMQVDGVLFDATAEPPSLPSTVNVVGGWNLISLISEQDRKVEDGVRGLLFPTQTFTSLAEFQKFVEFNPSTGQVDVVGGVFNPLFTGKGTLDMKISRGFYVFMSEADTHTP